MNAIFMNLALLCLFGNILPTHASDNFQAERKLNQSGPNCRVSASVTCTMGDTGKNCQTIGQQPFGTCGRKSIIFTYKFCNLNDNTNVQPLLVAPASNQKGTEAMYRTEFGRPTLNLSLMGPGLCREKRITDTVDTCKPMTVGQLRFEGWVEGYETDLGYYCYAYDYRGVEWRSAVSPPDVPSVRPSEVKSADIALELSCTYTRNGQVFNCENSQFTQLEFSTCLVPVTYKYKVINRSSKKVSLDAVLDVDFVSLVEPGQLIAAGYHKEITIDGTLDICEVGGTIIEKRALAFASPKLGGIADEARDNLRIDVPSVPFKLILDGYVCVIENDTSVDCNEYLKKMTSQSQCSVGVEFKYTVTNDGLGCVDVSHATSSVGPLGQRELAFEDFYHCESREICSGISWTIPDRRSVDFCALRNGANPNPVWALHLQVFDDLNRSQITTAQFVWETPIRPHTPAPAPVPTGWSPSKGKNKRA